MPVKRDNISSEPWLKIPLCYPASPAGDPAFKKKILEIGPGRGDFLFYLAETNKDALIIAVELKSRRYFKLVERAQERRLSNVLLIQADGRSVVETFFGPASIEEIHINFPDPWPKMKHAKNRLITKKLLSDCALILKNGGTLNIVTDSVPYAASIQKSAGPLENILKRTDEEGDVFPTYFANKWKNEGRKFHFFKWKKT